MTEEEARTKWCPFARAPVFEEGQATNSNRTTTGRADPDCKCIASDCMAWEPERTARIELQFTETHGGYCQLMRKS